MTILVTGAAGYVGNNAVRRLAETGRSVRAMVRSVDKAEKRLADVAGKIEIVQGDVTDRDGLPALMKDVSTVIHLVAISMEKRGRSYDEINYQGTVNVVDAADAAGVNRFINMSQNGADAASPYRFLRSKGRAQEYVAKFARNWTALRPSVIFGPQDEFFNAIAGLVTVTPLIFPRIGGGKALFQPVAVHDVVEAIARCVNDEGTIGTELALGGPEVLTLEEIEKRIFEAMGVRRMLFPAPTRLLRLPVAVMQRTLPGSPVSSSLLDLLAAPNITPDNALVKHFGIEPTPFSGDHIAYLKQNTFGKTMRKLFTGAAAN